MARKLSPEEREQRTINVLQLRVAGHSYSEIGRRLGISRITAGRIEESAKREQELAGAKHLRSAVSAAQLQAYQSVLGSLATMTGDGTVEAPSRLQAADKILEHCKPPEPPEPKPTKTKLELVQDDESPADVLSTFGR